jgi:O-antigen/teichoic acid export membrane protein
MNTAAKAITLHGLKRRALSLGAVKAFDHAVQFLLPVILVRCLDTATFGEYRLLWLAVGTLMAVATLNMCGSLYYFVPRSEPRRKRAYIHNTIIYLAVAGLVCGLAVSPWNPWLPAPMKPLEPYGFLVSAFVMLWVASFLLEFLPTVEERIGWQAYATLGIAVLRAALVGVGAWASGDLRVILWLLIAVVAIKLALLLYYVFRHHGLGRPWFERAAFVEQFRQAAPFGISNMLFSLRAQADQWIAASLFALSSFAAFSIAAIVGQVVHIFRHSVMEAFMPTMSRMEAAGDVRGMLELNSRANLMVGSALLPLLAVAFVFAEEIVTIVYTASYVQAAPVMRVYIVGMAAMVIEIGSIVLLLRQGPFALRMTAAALVVSVAASWSAAQAFGLAGAAAGSVVGVYMDRTLMLRRVSRLTGIAVRQLQHWRALGWALATASVAAGLSWVAVAQLLSHQGPFLRLIAGTAVLGAAYGAMNLRRFLR